MVPSFSGGSQEPEAGIKTNPVSGLRNESPNDSKKPRTECGVPDKI
jgi:hypothetical protein